jgi:excisionase family DNA binding protein
MSTREMPIESLWTVKDVAAFLRCSTSLVYKKAEGGELPSVHVGSLLRFVPEAVRKWSTSNTGAP